MLGEACKQDTHFWEVEISLIEDKQTSELLTWWNGLIPSYSEG